MKQIESWIIIFTMHTFTVAIITVSYLLGSTLMNTLLNVSMKEKEEHMDTTTLLTIHVMSMLWPVTMTLTASAILIGGLKKLFISR
jgi:hypothetical protein